MEAPVTGILDRLCVLFQQPHRTSLQKLYLIFDVAKIPVWKKIDFQELLPLVSTFTN